MVASPLVALTVVSAALALAIGLSVGVQELEFEDSLSDLWIEVGSRADDERKVVEKNFGGGSRITLVSVQRDSGSDTPADENDPGIITPEGLFALRDAISTLTSDDGTLNITRTFPAVGGGTKTITLTNKDLCDRIETQSFMKPFTPTGLPFDNTTSIGSWAFSGRIGSGGLYFVSRCIGALLANTMLTKNSTTVTNTELLELQLWHKEHIAASFLDSSLGTKQAKALSRLGLPDGFGVQSFPCTRALALDCWSDGIFDYPSSMVTMNDYAESLFGLQAKWGTPFGFSSPTYNFCRGQLTNILTLAPAGSNALVEQVAFGAIGTAFGYWWRPSIASQTSTLAASFFESLNNTVKFAAADCVSEGFFRKASVYRNVDGSPPAFTFASGLTPINGGCCVNFGVVDVTSVLYLGGLEPADFTQAPTTPNRFVHTTRLSTSNMPAKSHFLADRLKADFGVTDISEDDIEDMLREWEQVWIDSLLPAHKKEEGSGFGPGETHDGFKIDFIVDRSIGDLLVDAAQLDGKLLVAGYIVLIVYSMSNYFIWTWPLSAASFVYSRSILCLAGICLVGLAILASFGFCAWAGITLSPLNSMLVPFLGVGLGVDDIFVMLNEYLRHAEAQDDIPLRMQLTLADGGSSVTVTSAANTVAFLMPAAFIRLPAVFMFSYQMGAAIILNWIILMFVFVPLMVVDAHRVKARKSIFFCMSPVAEDELAFSTPGKYSVESFVQHVLNPLYCNGIFKVVSLTIFFGATIALGIIGFTMVDTGLRFSDVALTGTYVRDTVVLIEDYYPTLPGSVITREIDTVVNGNQVDMAGFQNNLVTFLTDVAESPFIDSINNPKSLNWLTSGTGLLAFGVAAGAPFVGPTIHPAAFYPTMRSWLTSLGSGSVTSLACQNTTTGVIGNCKLADGVTSKIVATSGSVYYVGITTDELYREAIKKIRDVADQSQGNQDRCCGLPDDIQFDLEAADHRIDPSPIFFSGSLFNFWQQYVTIERTAIVAVGFSLLGVFVATLLFQFSPISSLLVGIMLLATVLQLYGFMYALGIKLNGFSVTNLAVAVGMTVEFTAHISYAYLRANARSNDRNERMCMAMNDMFPPMVVGALTTIISVVCVAFAKYPFFSLYYFQMIAMMQLLAFLNGLWFLPIILSLVAPVGLDFNPKLENAKDNLMNVGL